MGLVNIGERVGALLGVEGRKVKFLGYGVYQGFVDRFNPGPGIPTPVGFTADMGKRFPTNPLIKLDNGKYAWGCECWWGAEEEMKQ